MTRRLGPTYRVQLGPGFTFDDAAAVVPYVASLGVSMLYVSPVAEAVPGSPHGYDGTDPTSLRSELGGAPGFARLSAALEAAGVGLLVDIVPNHLSTWPGGRWWREVLRSGEACEAAEMFDVDWRAGGGRVALPVLDRPVEDAVADGSIRLGSGADGEGVVEVGGLSLPVTGGTPRACESVADVLAVQHYRLVDWHDRSARNYRRFFDVDGLVGVRVERPEVFETTHALLASLVSSGAVSAVRVDHVDGLARPAEYLARLRRLTGGIPVVVEKILTGDERLRAGWPVAGTTGYETLDDLGGALSDPDGLAALAAASAAEGEPEVEACRREGRHLVASTTFAPDITRLSLALRVDPGELAAVTASLPCYRTYLDGGPVDPEDSAAILAATAGHETVRRALLDPGLFDAVVGWQQLSGAVMAKGVEDTAWYRLPGRLASCEVGGDPGRDRSDAVSRLHERAAARAADGRAGLVPSSTHDTKRSGDARARLAALAELAPPFEAGLARLRERLSRSVPTGGAELPPRVTRTLAQTVLAVLPFEQEVGDDLAERVGRALVKSEREAKLATSWDEPDPDYEAAVASAAAVAAGDGARAVHDSFGALVADLARLAATLSLGSVVLRACLPGVPDCYQGDESWNLSLVDPDNRRPVPFVALASRLAALRAREGAGATPRPGLAAACRASWRTGEVKLLVTYRSLAAHRLARAALAPDAPYRALAAGGPRAGHVVAFARGPCDGNGGVGGGGGGEAVLAIATRRPGGLPCAPGDLPAGAPSYGATSLELPPALFGRYLDVLSGRRVRTRDGTLAVAEALCELPVALLVREGGPGARLRGG